MTKGLCYYVLVRLSIRFISISSAFILILASIFIITDELAAAEYTFPVLGSSTYSNDFHAPRTVGGVHRAIDIFASKGRKIVSVKSGTVVSVVDRQHETAGYMLKIKGDDGLCYWYLHLNNDTRGSDDGQSGPMGAFAPDIEEGNRVKRGQLIGYLGDSGNAEGTSPHLHFEVVNSTNNNCQGTDGVGSNNGRKNPYTKLKSASRISKPIRYPALPGEILPYGSGYNRTVNVVRADVTGDGEEDLITGAEGIGSRPKVHVYNPDTGTRLGNFFSLSDSLDGGVDVAAGDIDGDGKNEVITGVRASQDAKIGIYRYNPEVSNRFEKVDEFIAYTGNNRVRVTTGDIDGDGKDEIITGTGPGVRAVLRIFGERGEILKTYYPFGQFSKGMDVAAGNLDDTESTDEIAIAPLTVGSSTTKIYSASSLPALSKQDEFYAYGASYRGGIRLSVGDIINWSSGNEIITIPSHEKRSVFRVITPSGQKIYSDTILEDWWLGYHDIAASQDGSGEYSVGTGRNRRGSVR